MKKVVKWIVRILGALIIGAVVAAVLFPLIYKDRVQDALKSALNERINAEVDFSDVDLSLFRSFPRVSIRLDSLSIRGNDVFEEHYLLRSESVDLTLAFFSLINEDVPYTIHEVNLNKPILDIIVLSDGRANYQLTENERTTTEPQNYSVALEEYTIQDGFIMYRDRLQDLMIELDHVEHTGKGDFSQDVFSLSTNTNAEAFTLRQQGIDYLDNVTLAGTVDLEVQQKEQRYSFKNTDIRINALPLKIEGNIQNGTPALGLDVHLSSKNASFKELFSLIPGVYKSGYERAEFSGTGNLSARILGEYNAYVPRFPQLDASVELGDGRIVYPGSPKVLNNVQLKGLIRATRGDWSDLSADFSTIGWTMDGQPGQATFKYDAGGSSPSVAGSLDATIQLSDWEEVVALADGQKLSGKLVSDLSFSGELNDIAAKNYSALGLDGSVLLEDFSYQDLTSPAIAMKTVRAAGTPQEIVINVQDLNYGKTQVEKVSVKVNDPLVYFTESSSINGEVEFEAERMDYADFVSEGTSDNELQANQYYPDLNVQINGIVGEFIYDQYLVKEVDIDAKITGEELKLEKIKGSLDNNPVSLNGNFTSFLAYSSGNATLKGLLNINGDKIDLNPYLVEGTESEESMSAEAVLLPEDMDVLVNLDIKEVIYTNLVLNNVVGQAHLIDQQVNFENIQSAMLGGNLELNGFYSTPPDAEQKFDVALQIQELPFQNAVKEISGFRTLAPIMKYLTGAFNTTLSLNGALEENMELNYKTLNGGGFLETIKGTIKGVPALNSVTDKLNIDIESLIELANSKSVFEINDGAVVLKPETLKLGDNVNMTVAGSHGIDQAMNYTLNFAIPRELLKNSSILGTAEKGLGFIERQAEKYGVNIDQGNTILIDAIVTGSLTSPKVDIRPRLSTNASVGNLMEQEKMRIQDSINQVIADTRQRLQDSIRAVITERENQVKDEINDRIDSTKATIKNKIDNTIDSTKTVIVDDVKDKIKDGLGGILGGGAKQDSTSTEEDPVKDATDKLKDEIKQWNPFKKQ